MFKVHRLWVIVKSELLIRELCDRQRHYHVTAGRETRENNLIACKQDQRKKVTLNGER
jgi:hypothetical protein